MTQENPPEPSRIYDLCVIGGGINGAGIARDAAGRGLKVILLEAHDLASATSSASTKLIHGGLRYLEQYEFRLVAEALGERECLVRAAPHIIWPLEFILPHEPHLRPAWMIRMGLFLYDCLGKRRFLAASKGVNLRTHKAGAPLKPSFTKGFSYADCWVDDARLVVLNARDAADKGADIRTRAKATSFRPEKESGHWFVGFEEGGHKREIQAKALVNAAGPWVQTLLEQHHLTGESNAHLRLVKGSHIVVPKLYDGEHAYILQQPDKRIVFAIPYEEGFTLIGTTDVHYEGDPAAVKISEDEMTYLCEAINRSFEKQVSPHDVVWSYSGVRALYDDGDDMLSEVTRDYVLEAHDAFGPPILNVFGGKLTTYRKLAAHALDELLPYLDVDQPRWTRRAKLPGGDIPDDDFDRFLEDKLRQYAVFPAALIKRFARAYGTCMDEIIGDATKAEELGRHYGDDIYESEIRYLVRREWARSVEDIFWRRSKRGLHVQPETIEKVRADLPKILQEEQVL